MVFFPLLSSLILLSMLIVVMRVRVDRMQEGRNVCLIIIMKSKELPSGGNRRSGRLARGLREKSQ